MGWKRRRVEEEKHREEKINLSEFTVLCLGNHFNWNSFKSWMYLEYHNGLVLMHMSFGIKKHDAH